MRDFSDTDFIDSDCDCAPSHEFIPDQVSDVPLIYSLELTPICNSRCPGCSNVFIYDKKARSEQKQIRFLKGGEWIKVLNKISGFARKLKLTGGEPTTHPDFEQIVQAIHVLGIRFTLFTNGRWQSPEKLVKYLQNIPECNGLLVSLHGSTSKSHESFTGIIGSFAETVTNIRKATQQGLRIHTSTVITNQNFEEINQIVELSTALGARKTVFNRYLGPLPWPLAPTRIQLKQAVDQIEYLISNEFPVKYGNPIPSTFTKNSSTKCLAGLAYCTIDPMGFVRPCNHSPKIIGNIFEQSISEIWHDEIIVDWRNKAFSSLRKDARNSCHYLAVDLGHKMDPLAVENQNSNFSIHLHP